MYKFYITRIRLDLGTDCFTEAVISAEVQARWPAQDDLFGLVANVKEDIKSRQGEFVEFDGENFVFDTLETTVYGMFITDDENPISEQLIEAVIEELNHP